MFALHAFVKPGYVRQVPSHRPLFCLGVPKANPKGMDFIERERESEEDAGPLTSPSGTTFFLARKVDSI